MYEFRLHFSKERVKRFFKNFLLFLLNLFGNFSFGTGLLKRIRKKTIIFIGSTV